MSRLIRRVAVLFLTVGSAALAQAQEKKAAGDSRELVADAGQTWNHFWNDPNLTWFRDHARDALGFVIAPKVVKAGGRAILVTRGEKSWNGPAFYSLGASSAGFSAGITVAEGIALVITQKGIDSLMSPSFKFGPDASVAIGPAGIGVGGSFTTDFVLFTRAKGLYGGVNVEGAAMTPTDDWNQEYYGRPVTPSEILKGDARQAAAAGLLSTIARASRASK